MLKSAFFSLVISFFMVSVGWAGTEVGNGGFGVMVDGQLYLQDLVEAGIHDSPLFLNHESVPTRFQEAASQALEGLNVSPKVLALVASKLYELEFLDRAFAYTLTLALKAYSWRIVTVPLEDPRDSDGVIDEDQVEYLLLAVRSGKVVRIQKKNWALLNSYNQAALIFHEMIYALLKPTFGESKSQRSQKARDLTGYIFSSDLQRRGASGLAGAIGKSWYFGYGRPAIYWGQYFTDNLKAEYIVQDVSDDHTLAKRFTLNEVWDFTKSMSKRADELCGRISMAQNIQQFDMKFSRQRHVLDFDVQFPTNVDGLLNTDTLLSVKTDAESFETSLQVRPHLQQCQADLTPTLNRGAYFLGEP